MLRLGITSNIDQSLKQLDAIVRPDQLRYSIKLALDTTAKELQSSVREALPQRFTLRNNWVRGGILTKFATKQDLSATVFSRDEFMGLQETGGTKNPLGNYLAIPTSMVRRTPRQMIRRADRPRALGDKAELIDFEGRKWLALKRPRKAANGQRLRLLYLMVPRASLKPRFMLEKDGDRLVAARFPVNLAAAIERAMRSAR